MKKITKILVVIIIFSSILNAQIPLSKRYGEYYDKTGRKLTIDRHGYGVFEDKGVKSRVFQIGKSYSQETDYSFKMYRRGSYKKASLIFTDKYSCIFILNGYVKYTLKKSPFLKDRKENDYIKYHLK